LKQKKLIHEKSSKNFENDITATDRVADVFEKYDPTLHGPVYTKMLKSDFVRKYLAIAKCMKPQLDNEASALITVEYARLRSWEAVGLDAARTLPVTPRTVESMIRLSAALAKGRLSWFVEAKDVNFDLDLINKSYFQHINE